MVSAAACKPEGGFVFIPVVQLCMVWWAYREGLIRLIDLRVWFAAHELVARRCQLKPGQQPVYTCEELYHLVGGGGGIRACLQRLTAAGVMGWTVHQVSFPDARPLGRECAGLAAMLAQIRNHHRLVPVPRRLLRFLAGGCRRSVLATLLGHLFRCLYYSKGQCKPHGLCKASWIAEVFGVSLRCVKAARHHLEEIALLQRMDVPQWVLNRYGPKMAINLRWQLPPGPVPIQSIPQAVIPAMLDPAHPSTRTLLSLASAPAHPVPHGLTPPQEFSTLSLTPPDSYQKLSMRVEHQKPACSGSPGGLTALFEKARKAAREGSALTDQSEPVVMYNVAASTQQVLTMEHSVSTPLPFVSTVKRTVAVPLRPVPLGERPVAAPGRLASVGEHGGAAALPPERCAAPVQEPVRVTAAAPLQPPTVRNITIADLTDTGRLLALYAQTVQEGLMGAAEAERLTFVALACHVVLYRPQNAGGLLRRLLTTKCYHFVTQEDEDRALHRLKQHLYGEGLAPPQRAAG